MGGGRTCVGTEKQTEEGARGRKGEYEDRGRECEGEILSWPVRSHAHKGGGVLYHKPEIVSFPVIYVSFCLGLFHTDRLKEFKLPADIKVIY